MKSSALLLLALVVLAAPAAVATAQDAEPVDPVEPQPAGECWGYVGSIHPGDQPETATFCATHHSCETEWQRAFTALCQDGFGADCADRNHCPEGQECRSIRRAGGDSSWLSNCRRLANEPRCNGGDLCVCTVTIPDDSRIDCGCQCVGT